MGIKIKLFGKKLAKESDEALMQSVQKGDAMAFSELYDRYATALLNYFHRMLWKDREKAEDLTQDIFTMLLHKPESYQPGRSFKTWLYSIANNMCKNEYRKQQTRSRLEPEIEDAMTQNEPADPLLDNLDKLIFNERLFAALDTLGEEHRNVFVLRYYDELSLKEISEVSGVPEGTVKSRLHHALKKLAQRMQEFKPEKMNL